MALFHDPTFWYALSFVLFFVLLGRTLKARVRSSIQAYQDTISGQFEDAKNLLQEAEGQLAHARIAAHTLEQTLRSRKEESDLRLARRLKQLEEDWITLQKRRDVMLTSQIAHLEAETQHHLRLLIAKNVQEALTAYWTAHPGGAEIHTLKSL